MAINIDLKNIDIKGALSKLGNLRNYMNLVVPLIIVLVAALLFIPTTLLARALRQKVQTQSLQRASQLDRMLETPVSKYQYLEVRRRIEREAEDANRLEQLIVKTTQRPLLSNKIFPSPLDTSVLIFEEFGKRYRAGIEEHISRLGGLDAPSPQELAQHLRSIQGQPGTADQLLGLSPYGLIGGRGVRPGPGRRQPMTGFDAMSQNVLEMIDALCLERARKTRLYINPAGVAGYTFWETYDFRGGTEQALKDCWYWQLGYWVIEHVFETIASCNRQATNVLDAPVKRLIKVSFRRPTSYYGGGEGLYAAGPGEQAGGQEPAPRYILSTLTGLTPPCTARVSDDQIHVIHFYVSMVARAGAVMDIMRKLCSAKEHEVPGTDGQSTQRAKHNQITILEVNMNAIDRAGGSYMDAGAGMFAYGGFTGETPYAGEYGLGTVSHQLYRYGQDGVVQLDLVCEYMFEKAGYESIMPEPVKKDLQTVNQTAGQTTN
ncbi:MAG: hypothetical protein QHH07_08720 [Sedimentisphaerales bacterium]|nr:hypothetical protein [Sedimentisphaerales bacterium]